MLDIFFIILCIITFAILFLNFFSAYLQNGKNILLKRFINSDNFEFSFEGFKAVNDRLFNRQQIEIIFEDSSNVHVFSGIEDKSIIPIASKILDVEESDIKAGSIHKRLELNEFSKDFKTQAIKDIVILDKNNKEVDYFVSKGVKFDGNKQHISISLKNEKWNNIKSLKFNSTTKIDISLFYYCYGY